MATRELGVAPEGRSKAQGRSGYYFWMSALLLALVLIGFAPTLYLRAFFPRTAEPNMPFYLYLHGAVLTGWFVWLTSQAWLVRSGRTVVHRRMGWIGVAIAAGAVMAGPTATFGVIGRLQAAGLDFDTDMSALPFLGVEGVTMLEFASPIVWGNLIGIAVFGALVTAAVLLRKRPEYHKRLIVIASMGIIAPALARISRWPVFGGEDSGLVPIVGLALLLSVAGHDWLRLRKIHPATIAGTVAVLAGVFGSNLVATTEFGQAFVRSLG